MTDELLVAREAYFEAFGNGGPYPFGVDDETIAHELMAAVARSKPIDPDFDWYGDLPDDSVV